MSEGKCEKEYEIECRVILPSAILFQQFRDVLYQRLHLARPNGLFSVNLADAFASLTSSGNLKKCVTFLQNSLCISFSLGIAIVRSAVGSCSSS